MSLVPATTRKGGLVIAVAPELLPTLIHPLQGDGTAGGLFKADNPYEKIAIGTSASPGRLCQMDDEIETALRRRIVLAHLDNAATTVG